METASLHPWEASAIPRQVPSRTRVFLLLTAVALIAACSARKPRVDESVPPPWLQNMPVTPLEVTEYRVGEGEGEHALFLRLSRFPDAMGYSVQEVPPEVIVRLEGPATGDDLPEERVVVTDSVIPAMRVSRQAGALTVAVEILANELPPYRVEQAADWLIVRVKPPQP